MHALIVITNGSRSLYDSLYRYNRARYILNDHLLRENLKILLHLIFCFVGKSVMSDWIILRHFQNELF